MITLTRTTIAIALLVALTIIGAPAHAQREVGVGFGPSPIPGTPTAGPYRAINHDPATGRTYARDADDLKPKHRVPKRKTRQ
jgi:hypothetical protein